MQTRLYTRLNLMVKELGEQKISKNLFMTNFKEEMKTFFPNRVIKVIDSSDTRYSNDNPHLPFLFIEMNKENIKGSTWEERAISYTFLLHIDDLGITNNISPDMFVGAVAWQLNNIDEMTKKVLDEFDLDTIKNINPDFQSVLKVYLKMYLDLLLYLKEQHSKDYGKGLINGLVVTPVEIQTLLDRIDFDPNMDVQTEIVQVINSKYRIPINFIKLVDRTYEEIKQFSL